MRQIAVTRLIMRGSLFLSLSLTLSGCFLDEAVTKVKASFGDSDAMVAETKASVNPASLSGPNSIPWQLTPASAASVGQGEMTIVIEKPGLGRVRGTERALAQLDQRIVPFSQGGKIVSACKDAFEPQAKKVGAYSIEAAAAGPEKKQSKGRTQQVFFRIFYSDPKDQGVEVRQASVVCTIGATGALVQASPT